MGLDQYLTKKTSVKNWRHEPKENHHQITVLKNFKPTHVKTDRISYVIEDVGYWRKANAVHRWFVENVQKGVDDCGTYEVDREQFKKLLEEVELVLKARHLAPGLLPTQKGFFFGSTEYDDFYWEDMNETKKIITDILKEPEDFNVSFYYHSSW